MNGNGKFPVFKPRVGLHKKSSQYLLEFQIELNFFVMYYNINQELLLHSVVRNIQSNLIFLYFIFSETYP